MLCLLSVLYAILFFLVKILDCFNYDHVDEDCYTMLMNVSQLMTYFTYFLCLVCKHIVVSMMDLYMNILQVRSLYSHKPPLKPLFLHKKSRYQVRNIPLFSIRLSFDLTFGAFLFFYFNWMAVILKKKDNWQFNHCWHWWNVIWLMHVRFAFKLDIYLFNLQKKDDA